MFFIEMKHGVRVLVSEEDFEYLNQWRWHRSHNYAARHVSGDKEQRSVRMHRVIVERMRGEPIPVGYDVDHINGNGLDNRRENLRIATRSQNFMNQDSKEGSTSVFKGVSWDKVNLKWRATIKLRERQLHLGRYLSEEDAARAYDKAAREHFREFARLNFPDEANHEC